MYVLRVGIYGIICPDCNPDLNTSERHSQSPRVWTAYGTVPTYIWFIHTLPSYPILYHAIYANISALVWPGGGEGTAGRAGTIPVVMYGDRVIISSRPALPQWGGEERRHVFFFTSSFSFFFFSFFFLQCWALTRILYVSRYHPSLAGR